MSCKHDCQTLAPFPKVTFNRPGLDRIQHRIGGYAEMRDHVLARINAHPALAAWTHRFADDPGIALAEGAAVVGDVLTFYQSLYANEFFLRTARWRESVADLVRLLGYRLAPGLGGEATFAVLVKGERAVVVPKGFGFKAQIEGQEKPVVFESTAAVTAWPHLSRFHLYRPRSTPPIRNGTRSLQVVALQGLKLSPGDRLLVGVAGPADGSPSQLVHFQVAIVDRVWEAFGTTLLSLKGGLTCLASFAIRQAAASSGTVSDLVARLAHEAFLDVATTSLKRTAIPIAYARGAASAAAPSAPSSVPELFAFKLGSSHRHFGHDAPAKQVTIDGKGRALTNDTPFARRLDAATGDPANPSLEANGLALDSPVDTIASGSTVLVEGRVSQSAGASSSVPVCLLRRVIHVQKGTASWGPQTGPSTLLTLDRTLAASSGGSSYGYADIRTLNVHHVVGEGFRLRTELQPDARSTGQEVDFFGTSDEMGALDSRALLLVGPAGQPVAASVVAVAPDDESAVRRFRGLTLDHEVRYAEFEHADPKAWVYGNLVGSTQGTTEDLTVLGDGDRRQSFQTFPLPKRPLTHLLRPEETPSQHAELDVWVERVRWRRVDSFFGAPSDDPVYVVREDDTGQSFVQFGDGKTGARLPSGRGNVVVRYRTGTGATGALKPDTTPQAASRLPGLDKVLMPGRVVGGAAPESEDGARTAAPGRMQSLGRLVSLVDFEAEALAVPGVLKAHASWAELGGVPVLRLTVLTASEDSADAHKVAETLRALDRARGARRYALDVVQGRRRFVQLGLSVGYEARRVETDVRRAVLETLGATGEEANGVHCEVGLFSLARRQFGQSAHSSQVVAAAQQAAGVVWVKLLALQPALESSPIPQLAHLTPVPANKAAELVTLKPKLLFVPLTLRPKVYKALPCEDTRILALEVPHLDLDLVAVADPSGGMP